MNEDLTAEVQMALVRACRVARNANSVWYQLAQQFPELTKEEIKEACKPVIKRMME
ncbi:MAG: hypothetical protein SOI28_05565 [Rahnella inusitata]|jgi:thermostable 8-oxoguanine DNA glycosylase